MPGVLEPFEVRVAERVLDDLRTRLERTRWPEQPADQGWDLGVDVAYLRELRGHWADTYDWRAFESRLNGFPNGRWNGLHLIWVRPLPRSRVRSCRSTRLDVTHRDVTAHTGARRITDLPPKCAGGC